MMLRKLHFKLYVGILTSTVLVCAVASAQRRQSQKRPQQRQVTATPTPAPTPSPTPTPTPKPQCSLTLAQAPELRGLRLGMTLDQVANVFPSIKKQDDYFLKPDEVGLSKTIILSLPYPASEFDRAKFEGIQSVDLRFLDNALIYLKVNYEVSTQWRDDDEFALKISDALGFPNIWEIPRSRDGRFMICSGFTVFIKGVYLPSISMENYYVQETIDKRRAEIEEKKKKEFKP